jgi:amino acid adenylation domain-containing protein/thioester reductase-like protein
MNDKRVDQSIRPLAPCCNVIEQFVQICQQFSDHVAIIEDGTVSVTYGTFLSQSFCVAEHLKHITQNHANPCLIQLPVYALALPRAKGYLIALWATWMSGGAFFPLDPALPEQRKEQILEEANPTFVITSDWLDSILETYSFADNGTSELPVIEPRQLAYVIFTSGSTGTPKGVMVSHDGLMNLFQAQQAMFQVTPQSRYLWYLSPQFDASISDILVTMLSGATLVLETTSMMEQASNLPQLVEQRAITHLDIPPSLLKILSPDKMPACLETIVIGGESPHPNMVRNWVKHVRLINVYGPTEATVCTSMTVCDEHWNKPLLGNSLPNVIYQVVDEQGNEVCWDGTGELLIGGPCVALGYLNNPILTQEKFFFENEVPYYRTGDRVRRLKSETADSVDYEFMGRLDRQVKSQGKRIELEEIEAHLLNLATIYRVSVQLLPESEKSQDKQKLIAFIELKKWKPVEKDEALMILPEEARMIQHQLKQRLPEWMIPNGFYFTNRLPLTHSGKIDIQALQRLYFERHCIGGEQPSGETLLTDEMSRVTWFREAFSKVTGSPNIHPDDDFFQIGGDSLGVVELLFLCEKSGINLVTDSVYANPTPRHLAEVSLQIVEAKSHFMTRQALLQKLPTMPDVDLTNLGKLPVRTTILLTGVTGFLGSAVCYELLKSMAERPNDKRQVFCLVRANSKELGKERVKNTFKKYGLWDLIQSNADLECLFDNHFHFVCGDVSEQDLGIEKQEFDQLLQNVSCVIHCAAVVNMVQSCEQLYEPNVLSLKYLSEFCLTANRKTLHYASTLSVFVGTNHNRGCVFETDKLDKVNRIYGGYAQTKVAGELYLNQVQERYPDDFKPVFYRFGLLTGSKRSGLSSEKDFLSMFIKGASQFKSLPKGDLIPQLAVDITPVDEAASVFVQLILKKDARHSIYHIANEKPLYYSQWLEIMQARGVILRTEEDSQWEDYAHSHELTNEQQLTLKAICRLNPLTYDKNRVFDLFQATDIEFDMSHMKDEGISLISSVPSELMHIYIKQFCIEQALALEGVSIS